MFYYCSCNAMGLASVFWAVDFYEGNRNSACASLVASSTLVVAGAKTAALYFRTKEHD